MSLACFVTSIRIKRVQDQIEGFVIQQAGPAQIVDFKCRRFIKLIPALINVLCQYRLLSP